MASSDVPIRPGGVEAAPLDYLIPGSAEIQPLAVYAEFDGSGAAGNFKPALTLISTAGYTQWIAQTDETVTAGDDARVSWAPGFRGSVMSTPTTSGDYIFAPTQPADLFAASANRQGGTWWFQVFLDNTIGLPGGAYLNNYHNNAFGTVSANGPANGDNIYFRFALGPTGSKWRLIVGYLTGNDYGKINCRMASVPDTSSATPGVLTQYSSLTWINNWLVSPLDGYEAHATPRPDAILGLATITIGGQPGDAMTSWAIGGLTDGGPGIYALELFVDGKNAASTSYKAGLWALAFNRLDQADDIS